jgi:hypothetical protein
MRKADKNAIISSTTNLKITPTNVKILPFDDGSKKKITRKEL